MSYYLLFTDTHLDGQPENEYRWAIFDHIRTALMQYPVRVAFCLGDLVDGRDKFSATFVNRLLGQLRGVSARAPLVILRGNHDTALRPPNYFTWLSDFSTDSSDIEYIDAPAPFSGDQRLMLLPFSPHPATEWADLRLNEYAAAFMHATVTGSQVENGTVMENADFPVLPSGVKFYSGDVHVPQRVRNVTYVGAPHPIRFGDDYPCRMLLLDEDFDVVMEIPLSGPRKRILRVGALDELDGLDFRPGDQVKIEVSLGADRVDGLQLDEVRLAAWASRLGVTVAGVSVVLESSVPDDRKVDPGQSLDAILRRFAAQEGITEDLLATGLRLLGETR